MPQFQAILPDLLGKDEIEAVAKKTRSSSGDCLDGRRRSCDYVRHIIQVVRVKK